MERKPFAVYIKVDDRGYVTDINSSEFLRNPTGWVKIDEGYGDKYHHAQGGYLPEALYTDSNVYRYKYADGAIAECTAEELAEQEANLPAPPMSDKERIAELEAALELLLSGVTA